MDPLWWSFGLLIAFLLALDLAVFHRKKKEVSVQSAWKWTFFWIAISLLFNVLIFYVKGPEPALQFFTAYLVEKMLSVDNLFVFLLIFSFFKVPLGAQHRVLYWGIVGAIVLRLGLILAGCAFIEYFHFAFYILGAFLCYAGIRLFIRKGKGLDKEHEAIVRFCQKLFPKAGAMLAVSVAVEVSDFIFALDSIPAVFGITSDVFIVFTSNIFAVLGLRSLYFALAGVIEKLRYLKYGLGVILVAIGVKMILAKNFPIPVGWTLLFVVAVLSVTALCSLSRPRRKA